MKQNKIDQGHAYLLGKVSSRDYVVSLHGPTFIFTANVKLPKGSKTALKKMGIQVLGG